jgi:hypothetical protein
MHTSEQEGEMVETVDRHFNRIVETAAVSYE